MIPVRPGPHKTKLWPPNAYTSNLGNLWCLGTEGIWVPGRVYRLRSQASGAAIAASAAGSRHLVSACTVSSPRLRRSTAAGVPARQ